ncbi:MULTISPECIES: DUF6503 family protein [Flavobacteriaceae]|uniref:DUF6503 family protein n=1 Tax=Flavobacteriaceae TaxID=49546 RepID=UPI001490EF12|nr:MULTISPECIES: DUF6503 family protein [Allomuricauda]MDC6367601.1 DUF6503 family protein [Muricauda sp. AC10]
MKNLVIIILVFAIASCKPKVVKEQESDAVVAVESTIENNFPKALNLIFEAHGGLADWKELHTLVYSLPKKDFAETHTIDLRSRKDRIDTDNFSMGFDGEGVWLLDIDENYKGDAGFYHNLMFYFYAMPFVLADDGILYHTVEDLVFEGKSYPGIGISYKSGVGVSSKDEYFIYYDPETHQMAWLGYTVTYRSGEKSNTVKWIRYDDWQKIGSLTLPKSITWYNFEGATILEPRSTVTFENVTLKNTALEDGFYAKPPSAEYVDVKTN